MRVAIIGAGYAGLAAAVSLADAGVAVSVFEANAVPGGRARRIDSRGTPLDNGIHILIGAYRETLALIRKVGQAPETSLLRLPLDWHIHGRFRLTAAALPAPWHLALGLLRAAGATWRDRIAAARFLHAMRRQRYTLTDDCSVADLLARHAQGDIVVRALWEPLCLAALNTPPAAASARVFLHVLRDGLDGECTASDTLLTRHDLSALLPEPAARYVAMRGGEIFLSSPVQRIEHESGAFVIQSGPLRRTFTHVICATSPHHAARLISTLPGLAPTASTITALRYEPIHTVYLQYETPVRLPQPMLGLIGRTADWLFDRNVIAGNAGLIAGVISAGDDRVALTQEALASRVHDDVMHVTGTTPRLTWWRVIAEKRATFACTVNVERPPHRTPLPGLLLAGDYTASDYPATLEAAVRSGLACAQILLE